MVRDYAKNHGIVRLPEMPQNRGKGYCVRNGVMNAQGRIILFTDADLSSPMEEALKLLERLEAGADIAIGSRWMRSELQTTRQSLARRGLGRVFNLLLRMVLGLNFRDTQCGFKAFRQKAARTVFSRQRSNAGALTRRFYSLRSTPASKWSKCLCCGDMTLEPESIRWRMVCEWSRKRCAFVGTRCPGSTARALKFLLLSPWRRAQCART